MGDDRKWPFMLDEEGDNKPVPIYPALYYGFGDAGGFYGSKDGYVSLEDAIAAVCEQFDDSDYDDGIGYSTKPEDLGGVTCCIITGAAFVNYLENVAQNDLSDFGHWS